MQSPRPLAIVALVFSTMVLQGCIGSKTYYVDDRFTADEEADIKAAAGMWDDATGGALMQVNVRVHAVCAAVQ